MPLTRASAASGGPAHGADLLTLGDRNLGKKFTVRTWETTFKCTWCF
jgi:hypothetical protein